MESRSLKRARRIPWLTGVVLAGGESRRMGQPKAWMNAWGEPLLVRTVRTVSRVCASVVVVGAPGQVLPTVRARVVRDMAEGEGPLRAMEAGLGAVRTRAAFVCAVDLPFLRDDLIRLLAENLVGESWGRSGSLCSTLAQASEAAASDLSETGAGLGPHAPAKR